MSNFSRKHLLVFIILLVIAGIVAVFVFIKNYQSGPAPSSTTTESGPEKAQIFPYTGKIQSLFDNSFVILASTDKNKNQIDEGVTITVEVDAGTQYTEMFVFKTLPERHDRNLVNQLSKEQTISFSDLQVGDEVVVESKDNITDRTIITALKVQRMKVIR